MENQSTRKLLKIFQFTGIKMRIRKFASECIEIRITIKHILVVLLMGVVLFLGGFVFGIISNSPILKFLGL